jgi:arylsulfatase A-like enzyme/Tfp pilus assembly protein PilF
MRRWWTWVAAALLVAGAGWLVLKPAQPRPIEPGLCRGCNVLLITIDTLRSDRVGAFGGPGGLTPTLDGLAADGLRLTRAYSSAPLTLPSHASVLTGVSPPVHGLRTNGLFRLGPGLPTLATVLKSHGYRTGAFVGAFVLDARFGLNRGFDVYDDKYGERHEGDQAEGAERPAEDVIKPARAWILGESHERARTSARGQRDESESALAGRVGVGPDANELTSAAAGAPPQPYFAWVHLYDPHEPYQAPEPYASQHAPYDAEVAYTDAMIGKLLTDLKSAGQLASTLIVVAADHGESLGEHGERTHGVFAYDVTLRVPCLMWMGARIGSRVYDGLVRLIDLAPTTLDLVGISPPESFGGRSILAAIDGRQAQPAVAYFEAMDANLTRNWAPLTGIVSGGYKLIALPIPELYDLTSDPHEARNVYAQERERARTLEALLRETMTDLAGRGSSSEKVALGAEARQRLQALGYTASTVEPATRVYADADDPKMLIGPANQLDAALSAFKSGSQREAMAVVGEIIRQHPAFTTPYGVLARMQRDTGDLGGAIATLETIVRSGNADQSVLTVLGGYLQEAGALDRSAAVLETVIAAHPDYADAHNSLGVVYSRMGRHDRAQASFKRVLELDPTSATAYENLGVDDIGAGDLASAARDLTQALDLDPRLAVAHNALGTVRKRQGREAEAIEHWRTAVRLNPHLYDALYNLGTVLHAAGRRDEARPYLQRFVDEAPPARYARDIAHIRQMLEQ